VATSTTRRALVPAGEWGRMRGSGGGSQTAAGKRSRLRSRRRRQCQQMARLGTTGHIGVAGTLPAALATATVVRHRGGQRRITHPHINPFPERAEGGLQLLEFGTMADIHEPIDLLRMLV
jgi:hypothetical protein